MDRFALRKCKPDSMPKPFTFYQRKENVRRALLTLRKTMEVFLQLGLCHSYTHSTAPLRRTEKGKKKKKKKNGRRGPAVGLPFSFLKIKPSWMAKIEREGMEGDHSSRPFLLLP
jgi:hypothetical protein